MGGGLESRCVGRVYGADGAVHHPHRTHDLRSCSQDSRMYKVKINSLNKAAFKEYEANFNTADTKDHN
jgi:hypothetical protein